MKKNVVLLLLLAVSLTLAGKEPKYIFLFIGDGMATPQRMIADEFSRKTGKGQLVINTLPCHATTRTSSANNLVTDSAAAATAIACGTKTNNGMLGVDPAQKRLTSVAEEARDKGRKVGIVTSVTLNHATPAGFYGHRKSRSQAYDLGLDLVASHFDFFAGGGISKHDRGPKSIYDLAKEAIRRGGAYPAVLNAANEVAVAAFLAEKLSFTGIFDIVSDTFEAISDANRIWSVDDIFAFDGAARSLANEFLEKKSNL